VKPEQIGADSYRIRVPLSGALLESLDELAGAMNVSRAVAAQNALAFGVKILAASLQLNLRVAAGEISEEEVERQLDAAGKKAAAAVAAESRRSKSPRTEVAS
jgi:predicted transcriptional regulator